MKRVWAGILVLGALILGVMTATSPSQGQQDRPPRRDGPPPPRGFEPGKVLPPHIRTGLKLTKEQEMQLDQLEKEVKERLMKILTADQKKKLEELKRRPPPPPRDGPRRRPDRDGRRDRERPREEEARNGSAAGIQWFASWESGLREARRSGRPILLVSAAPHCAGVSGTW
jgi:Spy/CpxP family protein refolding chaperone